MLTIRYTPFHWSKTVNNTFSTFGNIRLLLDSIYFINNSADYKGTKTDRTGNFVHRWGKGDLLENAGYCGLCLRVWRYAEVSASSSSRKTWNLGRRTCIGFASFSRTPASPTGVLSCVSPPTVRCLSDVTIRPAVYHPCRWYCFQ